ncbi:formyltetrahydrofolate deformylase [Spirochaeta lutea]|uniref:Formyltetrahydrofolate deformylase n=1 Tax=Spirochaeta lutea TaxID=1480694 RepID=A0A098R537_9SPIO|nr:formyltetrahydrofolate deformylase [Spirochaeta lutea]
MLLLSCPDTQGIVAEVSHFIFTYGGNILDSHQHSDGESGTFFMRVEWSLAGFKIPMEKIHTAFEPVALKFDMDFRIHFSSRATRMAIMVSQYDHCLYDLILRNREGETHADIRLVIGNHPQMEEICQAFEIPFYHVPVAKKNKAEAEARQIELLREHEIDLVVLARYMQILSDDFVSTFPNRIINIHHSFLPAFIGAKPYHQAFARGVKIIGATSHYVTADLDQGPIIEQDVTRISHKDSVHNLIMKGRNLEKLVLSRAVKLHLEHRVLAYGNKTVVFD